MDNQKHINQILEKFYKTSIQEIKRDNGELFLKRLTNNQQDWLFKIVFNAESFKAIVTVLVTSLVKKIENPKQDIRLHKNELKGGYSGRTFDTKFITPFLKKILFNICNERKWLAYSFN